MPKGAVEGTSECRCQNQARELFPEDSNGIHTLRHIVVSKLLTSGLDLLVVSRMLSHDSIQKTVDIQAHIQDSTRKSTLALLA